MLFTIMQVNKYVFGKICRTCLSEKDALSKIIDSNITIENTTKSVLDLLNMLTTIELRGEWPNLICLDCLGKVTDLCKFKLQCEAANTYLENVFGDTYSSTKTIIPFHSALDSECKYDDNDSEISSFPGKSECDKDDNSKIKVEFKHELEEEDIFPGNFSCNLCPKSFTTKHARLQHKKFHIPEQPFVCPTCGKTYISVSLLKKHVQQAHSEEASGDVNENIDEFIAHVCTICSKAFKTKYILMVHEKRHRLKGCFLCPKCGKGFASKGCLNRHMRVHTGEKKFECTICRKKFPSNNNLKLHSRIHTGVKPYLCTVCGKSFSHPTGLTYHLKTHTKEKNYKCDICEKAFALQCHLHNHRKIHTGERPFQCTKCDKGFIKKIDLQRHEAVHSGSKPHNCSICSKEFLRELHLQYHMMIHTEERPHKCPYCGKGFIRKYYLKDHMLKHHDTQLDELNRPIS